MLDYQNNFSTCDKISFNSSPLISVVAKFRRLQFLAFFISLALLFNDGDSNLVKDQYEVKLFSDFMQILFYSLDDTFIY